LEYALDTKESKFRIFEIPIISGKKQEMKRISKTTNSLICSKIILKKLLLQNLTQTKTNLKKEMS